MRAILFFPLGSHIWLALASQHVRHGLFAGRSEREDSPCPKFCSDYGPNPSNWWRIHKLDDLSHCDQPLLMELQVHNSVRDINVDHEMRVCIPRSGQVYAARHGLVEDREASGTDIVAIEKSLQPSTNCGAKAETRKLPFHVGGSSSVAVAAAHTSGSIVSNAAGYLADYLKAGASCGHTVLFSKEGNTVVGLFAGSEIEKAGAASVVAEFQKRAHDSRGSTLQICDSNKGASQSLGIVTASLGDLAAVQDALKTWGSSLCLDNSGTSDEHIEVNVLVSTVTSSNATQGLNGTSIKRNSPRGLDLRSRIVRPRGECRSIEVVSGGSRGSLASRCGISGHAFEQYNPTKGEDKKKRRTNRSALMPKQQVCCSQGTPPDRSPKPGPDGTCATHLVQPNDNCWDLADSHYLETNQIEEFNKNTWG